ncbi:MAG: hypothetical protein RI953_701, partial [Pseudomonadota bacterium]
MRGGTKKNANGEGVGSGAAGPTNSANGEGVGGAKSASFKYGPKSTPNDV